jgi:hypothetical protein
MAATMDEILKDPVLYKKYHCSTLNVAGWREIAAPVDSVTLKARLTMFQNQKDTLRAFAVDTVRHCKVLDTLIMADKKLLDDWRTGKKPYPEFSGEAFEGGK